MPLSSAIGWLLIAAAAVIAAKSFKLGARGEERPRSAAAAPGDDSRWCDACARLTGARVIVVDEGLRVIASDSDLARRLPERGRAHIVDLLAPGEAKAFIEGAAAARREGAASWLSGLRGKASAARAASLGDGRVVIAVEDAG